MIKSHRRHRQKTMSKNGADRNHLARLLQERTREIESLKKQIRIAIDLINNIKTYAEIYDAHTFKSLVENMK